MNLQLQERLGSGGMGKARLGSIIPELGEGAH